MKKGLVQPHVFPLNSLAKPYCMTVKLRHAALFVTGVLPGAPALKRMTPSSLEQKFLTPELL
jgi:hypothetical protein